MAVHRLIITPVTTPAVSTATTARSIWDLDIRMAFHLAITMDGLTTDQDIRPTTVGEDTIPFTARGIHGVGTDLMVVFTADTTTAITTVSMMDIITVTTIIGIIQTETPDLEGITVIVAAIPAEVP